MAPEVVEKDFTVSSNSYSIPRESANLEGLEIADTESVFEFEAQKPRNLRLPKHIPFFGQEKKFFQQEFLFSRAKKSDACDVTVKPSSFRGQSFPLPQFWNDFTPSFTEKLLFHIDGEKVINMKECSGKR
eukprot:gene20722-22757_t